MDPSFVFLLGVNRYRDFHVQRSLNFEGSNGGLGFLARLQVTYLFSETTQFRLSYEAHRMFTSGLFKTRGGLSEADVLSNYVGSFRGYASTKEAYIELGGILKL